MKNSETKHQSVKIKTRFYIGSLFLIWLAFFLAVRANYQFSGWTIVMFWGALQFTLESLHIKLKKGATSSLNFTALFSAILLFGPFTAGTVALFAGVTWRELRNLKDANPIKWVFNSVQYSISAMLSAMTYIGLGGLVFSVAKSGFTLANFPSQILPLLIAIFVFYLTNTFFVSLAISLNDDISVKDIWKISFSWGDLNYLGLGFLGIIFAQVYFFEPVGLILIIGPLAIARQSFSRFMKLEDAYSSTIAALVKAIEAKDPYTRGHSERVSKLSIDISRALKLPEDQVESLGRISALHDIGKIGVPNRILTKTEKLSDEEFSQIKEHPRIGARILKDVGFLKNLIPAVYYHHEKLDGTGYSSGLTGNSIPLFARIISIADSYDAMTSDRAYRKALPKKEVVSQLIEHSGTQFDSNIVNALLSVIGENATEVKEQRVFSRKSLKVRLDENPV